MSLHKSMTRALRHGWRVIAKGAYGTLLAHSHAATCHAKLICIDSSGKVSAANR